MLQNAYFTLILQPKLDYCRRMATGKINYVARRYVIKNILLIQLL